MNACIDGRGGFQHERAGRTKGALRHAEAREDDAGRRRVERWHARELRACRRRALRQHEQRREDTAAEQRDEAEQGGRATFHHANVWARPAGANPGYARGVRASQRSKNSLSAAMHDSRSSSNGR